MFCVKISQIFASKIDPEGAGMNVLSSVVANPIKHLFYFVDETSTGVYLFKANVTFQPVRHCQKAWGYLLL